MSKDLKIVLIGPYPPPYGGLSVQIHELNKYFQGKAKSCLVLNIGESRKAKIDACINAATPWIFVKMMASFARRGFILHLFTNGHNAKSWISALVCSLAGLLNGRRTVVTFGSGNMNAFLINCNKWCNLLVHITLRLAGAVVCRNEETRTVLSRMRVEARKLVVMTGFAGIPDLYQVPMAYDFQLFNSAHHPLVGAIANTEPEYGVPLLLQAFLNLRHAHPSIGLVIIGLNAADLETIGDYRNIADLYLPGELSHDTTLSVMKELDVFVRPTYFDGDANSVREALALGVPVVASATSYRPPGVRIFPIGDPLKCAEEIEGALKEGTGEKQEFVVPESKFQVLEKLYLTLNEGLPISTVVSEKDEC